MAVSVAVGLWSAMAIATERDPGHYAEARSYYQFEAGWNHWPKARLDEKMSEIRRQLIDWIVVQVRLPVLLSVFSIPLLAWLFFHAGRDRWAVTWLTIAFALLLPAIILPVVSLVTSALGLHLGQLAMLVW